MRQSRFPLYFARKAMMIDFAPRRPMKIRETVIRSRNDEAIFYIFVALTIGKRKLKWARGSVRL